MIRDECETLHTSHDAIDQCVVLSSTDKFRNSLLQNASSIDEVAERCCELHPEEGCFHPPNGVMSSCSAMAFLNDENAAEHTKLPHYGNRTNSDSECRGQCESGTHGMRRFAGRQMIITPRMPQTMVHSCERGVVSPTVQRSSVVMDRIGPRP